MNYLLEKDSPGRLPYISPVCGLCKHVDIVSQTCAAFPDGIPDEIWNGENSHFEPYPGDRGFRFEFADDVAPQVREWWLREHGRKPEPWS